MKTYHYTSFSNWKKIKKEGLIPYEVKNEELRDIFDEYPVGIWLWATKLKGISHAGSVIFQAAVKNTFKVVQLRIKIRTEHILRAPDGRDIGLTHSGHIENLEYHMDEKSVIYTKPIKAKDIELVDIYDLRKRLK